VSGGDVNCSMGNISGVNDDSFSSDANGSNQNSFLQTFNIQKPFRIRKNSDIENMNIQRPKNENVNPEGGRGSITRNSSIDYDSKWKKNPVRLSPKYIDIVKRPIYRPRTSTNIEIAKVDSSRTKFI